MQAFPRVAHSYALEGGTLIYQGENRLVSFKLVSQLVRGLACALLGMSPPGSGNEADNQCPYLGTEAEAAWLTVGTRG